VARGRSPSTVAFLRALRARGVPAAAISSSRNAGAVLDAAGVRSLFDAQVDGVEAARLGLAGKPDPALLLEATRRLGVAPERAAVVGDALAGVEAGHRGGFGLVVGVDRVGQAAALAAATAWMVDVAMQAFRDRDAGGCHRSTIASTI